MPFRRLVNALDALSGHDDPQALRNDKITAAGDRGGSANFLMQGQLESVADDGYQVFVDGVSRTCVEIPDEPLLPGQMVWVSQTEDDHWVIHGSVKG